MLPDLSILKGQKLLENAKNQKLKLDILINFQIMCIIQEDKEDAFLTLMTNL